MPEHQTSPPSSGMFLGAAKKKAGNFLMGNVTEMQNYGDGATTAQGVAFTQKRRRDLARLKKHAHRRKIAHEAIKGRLVRGVADALDVSSTPARDTLNRLVAEGVLVYSARKPSLPYLTKRCRKSPPCGSPLHAWRQSGMRREPRRVLSITSMKRR